MKISLQILGIFLLLTAVLAGCNSASSDPATGTTGGTDEERLTIGISIPSADHGWTGGVVWWANKMKEDNPEVDVIVSTAKNAEEQATQLETMMTKGMDGLVVLAHDSKILTPAVKKAKENGVYVVSVDRGLTEDIANVYMAGDNEGFGREAAKFMAEKLDGKGNILMLEGLPTVVINQVRVDGFKNEMAKHPDVKILESQPGEWDRSKSYKAMQTMLLKHKNVDAVWAADDDMALGVKQALDEAGLTDVWIVGGGGMKDVVKMVMDGNPNFPATVTYSPKMIADGFIRCLDDLKAHKDVKGAQEDVTLSVDVVTPDNAKDFYYEDSSY